ncbi:MAG: YegP family protein [Myxococcales bacterium]|nr:YegP family protein [Myxococcales bacterium]
MSVCKSLFLCGSLLALVACQQSDVDPSCIDSRCDEQQALQLDVMQQQPFTPGSVKITHSQQAEQQPENWRFEVTGAKGDIALMSQDYVARASAINGMLRVEELGVDLERYELQELDGVWSFVLRATNGQVIADSRAFDNMSDAEQAMQDARALVAGIVQYKASFVADGAKFTLEHVGSTWNFELLDDAGDPVLESQVYSQRSDALNGIDSVRTNAKNGNRYELLGNPPRFILKARNGQEIAESSTSYSTMEEAQNAADSTQALVRSEKVANPW